MRRLCSDLRSVLANIREIRFTLPQIMTRRLLSIVTFVDLRLWRRRVQRLKQASPVILLFGFYMLKIL